jgi:hypothetical protein
MTTNMPQTGLIGQQMNPPQIIHEQKPGPVSSEQTSQQTGLRTVPGKNKLLF